MTKKHLIGYPVAVLLAIGAGAATAGTETAPVETKTVTKTVTQAPAECGVAMDLASQFADAVGGEHDAIGKAFTRAGEDGDMIAMATSVGDAAKKLTVTTDDLTGPMGEASAICRAAVK